MEDEYQVLTYLQENEQTTQRKISKRTGLSLGAVNLLLKKMVRKGLIKIEKLNARTVRYILTPKGIQEKSSLTYRYIRNSYRQILKINRAIDNLLAEWGPELNGTPVIIYGPSDEIREIVIQHLKLSNVSYKFYDSINPPGTPAAGLKPVLVWRKEEEKNLENRHQVVNIITML